MLVLPPAISMIYSTTLKKTDMKLLAALLSLLFLLTCFSCQSPKKIQIYPEKIITHNFIGNGVQWSAYPHADAPDAEWGNIMTDQKWEMVFHRLDYMKPKLVRVMDQANWRYLKGFDEKGEPVLDFASPEVKSLQKLLDYCQENNITVMIGEWGCPFKVNNPGPGVKEPLSGANDPRWINMIVKFMDYLINTKGYTCLKYYILVNEPNGDWASTNGNWAEWSEGVKMLNKALAEAGLAHKISVAGPDVVAEYDHPESKYTGIEWVYESTRQLNDCIGLYDIHAYTTYSQVRSGDFAKLYERIAEMAKKVDKPIVFGEIGFEKMTVENQKRVKTDPHASEDSQMSVYDFSYGIDMADVSVQIMSSGYSGSAAWHLDDAMHTLGDKGDKSKLKKWGFWNSLGTEICNNPADENIRPWFYTWSLLCRYFPDGSNIIKADSTGIAGLRLVAGTKGNDMTIAVVNNSNTSRKFNLKIGTSFPKAFKKYLYSENIRPVDSDNFPVPQQTDIRVKTAKGLTVEIPANSFVLYTTLNF
jgi:hypothetical protein